MNMARAFQLAEELLAAIRELTAELRQAREAPWRPAMRQAAQEQAKHLEERS